MPVDAHRPGPESWLSWLFDSRVRVGTVPAVLVGQLHDASSCGSPGLQMPSQGRGPSGQSHGNDRTAGLHVSRKLAGNAGRIMGAGGFHWLGWAGDGGVEVSVAGLSIARHARGVRPASHTNDRVTTTNQDVCVSRDAIDATKLPRDDAPLGIGDAPTAPLTAVSSNVSRYGYNAI